MIGLKFESKLTRRAAARPNQQRKKASHARQAHRTRPETIAKISVAFLTAHAFFKHSILKPEVEKKSEKVRERELLVVANYKLNWKMVCCVSTNYDV